MRITIVRGPAADGKTWEEDFDLPDLVGESVSSALQYISRRVDGSMAYYLSCRRGICAACVVRINGKNEKACVVEVRDGMVIEPTTSRLMIKDSVVHLGMPSESEVAVDKAFARTDRGRGADRSVDHR
jgi:succinate dehydrogenase/fumarate reductase-like Fe-S protein